ncbi:hypothetical protein BJX99DRAFT_256593 [Aspergillus californicus]
MATTNTQPQTTTDEGEWLSTLLDQSTLAPRDDTFQIFLAIGPDNQHLPEEARIQPWVIFADRGDYQVSYTIRGGVRRRDGPYQRCLTPWDTSRTDPAKFVESHMLGLVRSIDMVEFEHLFFLTRRGPVQYFIARWFAKLFEAGLSSEAVVHKLTSWAEYTDREFTRAGENYFKYDRRHLWKWGDEIGPWDDPPESAFPNPDSLDTSSSGSSSSAFSDEFSFSDDYNPGVFVFRA